MSLRVGEVRHLDLQILEEADRDGGELRAGDAQLGPERSVRISLEDPAVGHGGNGIVEPVVDRHVGEVVLFGPDARAAFIRQQAEEDRRDLRSCDGIIRMDQAVGEADDIGEVVLLVQHGRRGVHRSRRRGSGALRYVIFHFPGYNRHGSAFMIGDLARRRSFIYDLPRRGVSLRDFVGRLEDCALLAGLEGCNRPSVARQLIRDYNVDDIMNAVE